MKINRNNYEAYFLDYQENNLSPEQVAELMIFLEQNPDLKESFESYENIELVADNSIKFISKENLKKSQSIPTDNINQQNYEEIIVAKYEGDISDEDELELKAFMELNPKSKLEYNLMGSTYLTPDKTIVHSDKESLKKKGFFVLYSTQLIYGLSIAASIIILLGVYFGFLRSNQQTSRVENEQIVLTKIEIIQPKIENANVILPEIGIRYSTKTSQAVIAEGVEEIRVLDNNYSLAALDSRLAESIKIPGNSNMSESFIEPREIQTLAFNELYTIEMEENPNKEKSFIRRFIAGLTGRVINVENTNKKTFFEYTIDGYNLISDREVAVEKETDENGKVVAYSLNGNNINLFRSGKGKSTD